MFTEEPRGTPPSPLTTGLSWQLHVFKAPSGVWSTPMSLTYNEVSDTAQICKTAIIRCVCGAELWVHTLLYEIPAYASFNFGTDHLFTRVNNFYQFGGIADLAVHSHVKVPGKENYSNLRYG